MKATAAPAALLALLLGACAAPPGPSAPREPAVLASGPSGLVLALDAGSQAGVACSALLERTLADGRIQVAASFRPAGPGPLRVKVACVFLDGDGRQVGPEEDQVVSLSLGEAEAVRFDSASPAARTYALRAALAR
jgi:hypothetical protein